MNENRKMFLKQVEKSETIVLSGHVNPDGDCIGACLGLALYLAMKGKKPIIYLEPFSEKYNFLPGLSFVTHEIAEVPAKPDLFISLDCADPERLGQVCSLVQNAEFSVNIDHHRTNQGFGHKNIVSTEVSSTCELLYQLIGAEALDKEIATCLYAGILYDTGGFIHTSTSSATHLAVSDLLKLGVPFNEVYMELFGYHTFVETKLMGEAFKNAAIFGSGQCIYTSLSLKEMERHGGSPKAVDLIVNWLVQVQGMLAAVFFYQTGEDEIKVSLRASSFVDVSNLAVQFGGGGHKKAAGFTYRGSMEKAIETILPLVERACEQ